MQNKFTQKARNTLKNAQSEAAALGHAYIGSEHLLLGLIAEKDSIAARVLIAKGLDVNRLRDKISAASGVGERMRNGPTDMTAHAKRIVETAADVAAAKGCTYVGTEHLLSALLSVPDCAAVRLIESMGVSAASLISDIDAHQTSLSLPQKPSKETATDTKTAKVRSSPLLSVYTRDLTDAAREGKIDPTIGREAETERVIRILSRRQKNNPCLVGEPGVGKTAVVEGLAARIANGCVPPTLEGKRILSVDIAAMVAGTKYRGEFEDRMKSLTSEAENDTSVILFIDELHVIMGAGAAEGAVDAANILKPALARGGIRVIGATTLEEYKRRVEQDAALERRFQPVTVEEPDEDTAIEILRGLKDRYEAHHKLKIHDEAICAAVRLSARYIPDRFLPDKALDLIDEAAAKMSIAAYAAFPDVPVLERQLAELKRKKEELIFAQDFSAAAELRDRETEKRKQLDTMRREMKKKKHAELFNLTEEHIAEIVTSQTGIPVSRLLSGESAALVGLEKKLSERIVGQPEAISAVCRAIRRGRMGISAPSRPTGSFIFLGKTGVGKTQLAVAVAEELLGSKNALVRFDMSEFMEKQSVSRLIGSPPGYVGYGEGGQLTEAIRRRPYCVLLLDEIEKAHPDVWGLLLQILEDGRLTDSRGRVVNFSNAVIIMTSNAGAADGMPVTGFLSSDGNAYKKRMTEALKKVFSPEFLGRIDDIVVFNDLTQNDLEKIAEALLQEVSERARGLGVEVNFEHSAAVLLASKCASSPHGARPLRHMVTSYAEDLITEKLLSGELTVGDRITVTANGGELAVEYAVRSTA